MDTNRLTSVEKAGTALVPISDVNKSRYLAYRAVGFSVMEAARLVGIHRATHCRWCETDPQFNELETERLGELRELIVTQTINLDYIRNFLLVMEKDRQVIYKSLATPDDMNRYEED